jgi:hypothetical protein
MSRDHLRPVTGDEGEELEEVQPAHEVARRLLVEAEGMLRSEESSEHERRLGGTLGVLALGWATLALTEPRQ